MALPVVIKDGSSTHRLYQLIFWGLALVVLFGLPFYLGDQPFRVEQFTRVAAFAVAILGLNLVTGYSGQISLGHSAFVGLGAYTTAILVEENGWPYLLTLAPVVVICFVVGVLVGIPAVRIRGLYLAVVTIAIAVTFPTLVRKFDSLTGGPNGKRVAADLNPPSWTGIAENNHHIWVYLLVVIVGAFMFFLAHNVLNSRFGRAVIAIRDNEVGAATQGINVPTYKALTFGLSAAFAGVAGTMLTMENPFVTDTTFSLTLAINLITGLVVGGVASLYGAIPGGLVVVFVPWFSQGWTDGGGLSGAVYGGLLILIMFVMPGGIMAGLRKLRARVVHVERQRPVPKASEQDVLISAPPLIEEVEAADEFDDTAVSGPLG